MKCIDGGEEGEAVHIVPSKSKRTGNSAASTLMICVAEEWIVLWNVDFVPFARISGLNGLNVVDKVFAIVWCAHSRCACMVITIQLPCSGFDSTLYNDEYNASMMFWVAFQTMQCE